MNWIPIEYEMDADSGNVCRVFTCTTQTTIETATIEQMEKYPGRNIRNLTFLAEGRS